MCSCRAIVPIGPFLRVVEAQDLRLDVRWYHHDASCPIVSHNSSTTAAATQEHLADEIQARRPHQWQCEADGDGRSVRAFASLAVADKLGQQIIRRAAG